MSVHHSEDHRPPQRSWLMSQIYSSPELWSQARTARFLIAKSRSVIRGVQIKLMAKTVTKVIGCDKNSVILVQSQSSLITESVKLASRK